MRIGLGVSTLVASLFLAVQGPGASDVTGVHPIELLLQEEHFDEAEQAVQSALAANDQDCELHRVYGDLLLREGHVFEADKEYKTAHKLDKKNARALYGIAHVFRLAGLRGKAAELTRAAHALAPEDPEIGTAFFALDNSGTGAIKMWESALENTSYVADPDRKVHAETQLAKAKLLNGRTEFELSSPYQHYELPYRVLYNGKRPTGIGTTITINGVKSELRLDTGAGGLTVSSGFAAKAGITRIGDSRVRGIGNGGAVGTWLGYADRMQIGNLEFKNIIVDVKDKGSVDDSGGLLGTDIFKRFLVKISCGKGQLELNPLPGPAWDGVTPVDRYEGSELKGFAQIFRVNHMLLIPTLVSEKQKSEQTNTLFLIDTGAGINSISTNLAPSVTKLRNNDHMTVRGVSGKVKMLYEADQVVLQFATYRQANLDLVSFDLSRLSRSSGLEVGGILGLPVLALFQSFTIDYRDARISFDYKPL